MNTSIRPLLPAIVAVLLACGMNAGLAEVPRVVTFQGKLTDPAGLALAGQFDLTFRLYNAETGGTPLWSETHTAVNVSKGIFAVPLGAITSLDPAFDRQYWISIQVGSDPEMSPRQPLTSTPYALRAAVADSAPASALPAGVIVMWSGAIEAIPAGWALCDGSNGTPDLRERFVIGASQEPASAFGPGASGGSASHDHSTTAADQPTSDSGLRTEPADPAEPLLQADHSHAVEAAEQLPPFYALAYIMKL